MPRPDDALVAADLAMYEPRPRAVVASAVYDEISTRHSHTRDRLLAVAQVRSALAEKLPVPGRPADPPPAHRRRCVCHELLLHAASPDEARAAAGAFLHVAEEFGLIGEIDLWVSAARSRSSACIGTREGSRST